jgi:Yip1 domain
MDLQVRPLLDRLLALAKTPDRAWSDIKQEAAADFWDIFPQAAVMAAIPPLITALYALLFASGTRVASFFSLLLLAPLSWVILLGGVWVVSYGIFAFAPYMQSRADFPQSLKLVSWGLSPLWVSSLLILPYIGGLAKLVGIMGTCYLWYFGFPRLLGTPKQPPTSLALFAVGAGFSYSTLTYLLQQLLVSILLQPLLFKIFS